mmetsp:Transcript_41453/g.120017  ORF Transcript_41453/g.120017 Transcript_41453/m.120017 type:complete len:235 (-) Transcript_41453:4390-5094(-)
MMLEVLHPVGRAFGQRVDVHLLVLGAGNQVAVPARRVAALQRQERVRYADALSDDEVRENTCGRAIVAIDDCRGRVRGVHEEAGRLPVRSRHESDASDASPGQLHLELELQSARIRRLQDVDAAAFGAGQKEEACVVELQRAHLRLDLQLLQDHAVLNVDESEDGIGVGSHENLRVERQESGHRHRRRVREHLQHLTGVDAPETHGLVDGGRDELILEQVEEDGRDGAAVADEP